MLKTFLNENFTFKVYFIVDFVFKMPSYCFYWCLWEKSQRKVNVNSTKRFVDFLDFNKTNERRLWVRHRRCHTEIPKNSLHIFCFGNQVNSKAFSVSNPFVSNLIIIAFKYNGACKNHWLPRYQANRARGACIRDRWAAFDG